jgi:hypothetical protein
MRSASLRAATIGSLLALLAAFALAPLALADAMPVELVLLYMPNVSNTGTPAASGIAELVLEEGEVRVSAADLPHLDGDARYVAWVLNTQTNEFFRLGAFNPDPANDSVHYENVLPDAIPNKNWDLFLVTVEKNGDAAAPSKQHSIAGTFPPAGDQLPPQLLPNTGGLPDDQMAVPARFDWRPVAGLAALTAMLGFGAGYGLGLKRR